MPPGPDLPPGEVHLWRFPLQGRSDRFALWNCLNDAERRQAEGYYRPEHGERFASGRGVLRTLVAGYLQQRPQDVAFTTGRWGKPEVASSTGLQLSFNLSHCEAWGVAAFARQGQVGIDIERVRHLPDAMSIARRQFSPAEFEWLAAADTSRQAEVFFRIWTRKEAVLKAVGAGLSIDLRGFSVTAVQGSGELHALSLGGESPLTDWRWLEFEAVPGYASCLVRDCAIAAVQAWEFGGDTA